VTASTLNAFELGNEDVFDHASTAGFGFELRHCNHSIITRDEAPVQARGNDVTYKQPRRTTTTMMTSNLGINVTRSRSSGRPARSRKTQVGPGARVTLQQHQNRGTNIMGHYSSARMIAKCPLPANNHGPQKRLSTTPTPTPMKPAEQSGRLRGAEE